MKSLIGQVFHRLTVVNRNKSLNNRIYWNCECECGNIVVVSTDKLKSGNTKSCGCFQKEKAKILANNLHKVKQDYITTAAKQVFTYYSDGNLLFKDFLELSQQNCFYCNFPPNILYNHYKNKIKSSGYQKGCPLFIYNGLDRINSNYPHNIDNVVPCCITCNRAKSNKPLGDFLEYLNKLVNNKIIDLAVFRQQSLLVNFSANKSIKSVYGYNNKRYGDGNLTLQQFYQLSQLDCYYCGVSCKNSNLINRSRKIPKDESYNYFYNGLDRLDSELKHNFDNIVSCCFNCNRAKSNSSFNDFLIWIENIKINYVNLLQYFNIKMYP